MAASIRVLDSGAETGRALREDLDGATRASIAVAFAKPSAWKVVDLPSWCAPSRSLRLLVGTDFEITDLDVLRELGGRPNAECKVMHRAANAASFHPKLYLVERRDSVVAYVGSSNLTLGGLNGNAEANVRIEGSPHDDAIVEAQRAFERYFDHELATALSPEFGARYDELRAVRMRSLALAHDAQQIQREHLRVAENLLIGEYRARVATRRWLLVTSPANYDVCMRTQTWGRQNEREARGYAPGDVFFMHVTGGAGILAMGMFIGEAYFDDGPLWREMDGRGAFPWRNRFVALGQLGLVGVSTKQILEPLRQGAPRNWFNGFIQASHTLTPVDFDALRVAFERELRVGHELRSGEGDPRSA